MVKLDESTDYLLESGETTGFLKHMPGCGQVEEDCPEDDPQPWFSEKLDWWFAVDGTSGPGLEFYERRIIGVVGTQSERDEIETPGGKLPYRGPR